MVRGYAADLIRKAQREERINILFLDFKGPQAVVYIFVRALSMAIATDPATGLALVVSADPPFVISPALGRFVEREHLAKLTEPDIASALRAVAPGLDDTEAGELARGILGLARPQSFNRDISTGFRHIVSRLLRRSAPVRVYIGASHKDREYLDFIQNALAEMRREGLIEVWSYPQIMPGEAWDETIQNEIEKADLFLFLVSQNFLSSSYAYDVEMTRAIERSRAGKARILPVIVRDSVWRDSPLGELQPFPADGQPLATAPDPDRLIGELVRIVKQHADEIRESAGLPRS
jgi:hypothetical protein